MVKMIYNPYIYIYSIIMHMYRVFMLLCLPLSVDIWYRSSYNSNSTSLLASKLVNMIPPIRNCPWTTVIFMAALKQVKPSSEFLKKFEFSGIYIYIFTIKCYCVRNMLSLGASKPWPDALEAFNGERTMSGKAIAEYFEPLRVWLEAENKKNNVHIGWTPSDSKCKPFLKSVVS